MSSEVCPFCGKTYKRLKSHLPHCKAAASSDTPPISHEAARTRGPPRSSSLEEEKPPQKLAVSAGLQSKRSKTSQTGLQTGNSSPSQLTSSAPLPLSAKKTKQKLSEQIKAAVAPPSLHPTTSHTKKTTVHEFIEAAGPSKVPKGAPKRIRAALEKPSAARREMSGEKGISPPASQPTGNPGSSKTKVSKKKATQALSLSLDNKPDEKTAGARERNHDWVTAGRKLSDVSVNVDSGEAHQPRITLQDAKAALGRERKSLKSSRPSILVQIESFTQASRPAEEQALSTSSASPSKPASTDPLRHDASPQLAPASLTPLPPLPPSGLSSQVHRAVTGLSTVSPSLTKLLPASGETPAAPDGPVKAKMQPEDRRSNIPDGRTKGVLAQQHLAQVRLKDLPDWLACRTPTNPRDLAKMVQKGWQWYYRKYIDVRKGGVGGVGMLLAGYCILSYIWSYPRMKRDRWRRFH